MDKERQMSAPARTAEGGPKDEAREPRGTLGATPLIKQRKLRERSVSPPARNEKGPPGKAAF